jgi:hypothetical protein
MAAALIALDEQVGQCWLPHRHMDRALLSSGLRHHNYATAMAARECRDQGSRYGQDGCQGSPNCLERRFPPRIGALLNSMTKQVGHERPEEMRAPGMHLQGP